MSLDSAGAHRTVRDLQGLMGSHRADTRGRRTADRSQPTPAGGRRKATRADRGHRRSSLGRSPLGRSPLGLPTLGLPALPTVIGATALLVAGAGTVAANSGRLPGDATLQLSAVGSHLGATDAFAFRGKDPRARAISRDSERQALEDAVTAELKDEAEKQNQQRSVALTSLAKDAEQRADQIAENQWQLPTTGYHLTGRFGMVSGLWSNFHTGLDFATDYGTPIVALANGVIVSTGYDGAYGYKTVQRLEDGTEIWYCHQSEIGVEVGDTVTGGQMIGRVGTTGNTTGPHLHLEVRPGGGDPVDPYDALIYHGVTP